MKNVACMEVYKSTMVETIKTKRITTVDKVGKKT